MNPLFSWFLSAAFLYHLIRGDHAADQAVATEPVKSARRGKATQEREFYD